MTLPQLRTIYDWPKLLPCLISRAVGYLLLDLILIAAIILILWGIFAGIHASTCVKPTAMPATWFGEGCFK